MGFINWQNLKKYIRRGTDAEVARIGHVNAVYDALSGGGPLPERIVTSITPSGGTPVSGDVIIDSERASGIGLDYTLIGVDVDSNSFSLGINVPYHEVIGTITFPANNGSNPILSINMCNTIDAGAADWSIAYTAPSGVTAGYFNLNFGGDSSLYRTGVFTATINVSSSITSFNNYQLVTASGFSGLDIRLRLMKTYTAIGGGDVQMQNVNLTTNPEILYNFNLKVFKNT